MSEKKKAKVVLEGRALCEHAAHTLFEMRCEKVQLIDLRGLSDVADWFLVATCTSEPQMSATLDALTRDCKAVGVKPIGIEYRAGVRWAVLDVGEMMVHLFEVKAREEYSLDRLWRDGKSEMLDESKYTTTQKPAEVDGDELL